MPMGIPANGVAHCKKCGNRSFPNMSSLRKHQWKAHKGDYANVGKNITSLTTVSVRDVLDLKAPVSTKLEPKPEMSARQLLAELINQRDFMNDVVTMVETIMNELS